MFIFEKDSTAVKPPAITEIRRPNSFCNLFIDNMGNDVGGSIAIPDLPDWQRIESEEDTDV